MILYINGQDIRRLVLGDCEENIEVVDDTAPELFLKEIVHFLNGFDKTLQDLETIYVVNGPGSATALRAILAIVNTIKFARPEVKVIPVEKEPKKNDKLVITELEQFKESEKMILPIYKNAPRITISKRDQLRRKK